MVVFDSTILSLLLFPDASLGQLGSGDAVEFARERVEGLVRELEQAGEQVLIPAPVLCEVLVTEGADIQEVLDVLSRSAFLRIGDFDQRAAVELAVRLREAIKKGDPREGLPITKSAMNLTVKSSRLRWSTAPAPSTPTTKRFESLPRIAA